MHRNVPTERNRGAAVSPQRLTSLDALRGFASLLVLFYHLDDVLIARGAEPPFWGLGHGGARGVDLLFVLSGYVMGRLYLRDGARRISPADFLKQRARRLLPAFWIVSVAALSLYLLGFGGADKAAKLEPWRLVASFLLLPQDMPPLVNVSWFLVYEALFYALVALALFNRRLGLGAIVAWQGLILVLWIAGHPVGPSEAPGYLHPRSLGLGIGVAFALLGERLEREGAVGLLRAAFLASAGLFLADIIWEGIGERDTHGVPIGLLDIAAGTMLLATTSLERRCGSGAPGLLVGVGTMSYSVYLTHFATMTLVAAIVARLGMPLGTAGAMLCLTGAMFIGAGMHFGIDRPLQAAFRRRSAGSGASPRERGNGRRAASVPTAVAADRRTERHLPA